MMQWSHYSNDLFDAYTSTEDNILVQSCPGSGKTTNIKHMWQLDNKRTLYLVFNKHNQVEAEAKLPKKTGSAVKTLNGLGHSIMTANFGRVKLDDKKVSSIVRSAIVPRWKRARLSYKEIREQEWSLIKAVSKAKMYAVGDTFSLADFDAMCTLYDLEGYADMYSDTVACLEISDSMTSVIDFDDQIRMPAIYKLDMPSFDCVLGDEVQDFSPIQAKLIANLQARRYVLVGDCHQSIYGFRGAMNDSMQVLQQQFNCVTLPLSITYRCGSEIVAEAAEIYPDIEPWSDNIRGVVRHSNSSNEGYDTDTLVLCRMNRPLVKLAYDLLGRGIPCHVRGRDIGQGLAKLIDKQDCDTVRDLIAALQVWVDLERAKALAKEDEAKLQSVQDKYESLMLFISKCSLDDNVQCVKNEIAKLFEQGKGVCLSTVHKAKGLEARRAMLLESQLYDKFTAMCYGKGQLWQAVQEKNIKYVAVTRGIQELVYM